MSKLNMRSEIWYKMKHNQPVPLTVTMEGTGSAVAELFKKKIIVTLTDAEVDKYINISTPIGFRVVGGYSIHTDANDFDWQLCNTGDAITSAIAVAAVDADIDHAVDIDDAYNEFARSDDDLRIEINQLIASTIGAIAKIDKIQFVSGLPKTRSGKIMRRILRKIASNEGDNLGDISTLLNPEIVEEIKQGVI